MKNEIDKLTKLLTVSEIGIGASLFVGLVGVVVCFILGAQILGGVIIAVAVIGVAASITGTVLLGKEINLKNDVIQDKPEEITKLNQDIIALQTVNVQFKWLQQANVSAQNALTAVVQM